MIVEATASLAAAWMARSPALLAFGGDSAIELLSAILVLGGSALMPRKNNQKISRPESPGCCCSCLRPMLAWLQ
jgi:hypothetical protein